MNRGGEPATIALGLLKLTVPSVALRGQITVLGPASIRAAGLVARVGVVTCNGTGLLIRRMAKRQEQADGLSVVVNQIEELNTTLR